MNFLKIFSLNLYVYYLTRGFNASIPAFKLLTYAFDLPTRAFNIATHAFSLLACGFELVTCGFGLAACISEPVVHNL